MSEYSNSIVLIGMSNIGKSFWSLQLEKLGYTRICVDDEIEKRLGPRLDSLGYRGIAGVSDWMGQPFDIRYKSNSDLYLAHESDVMAEILERIRKNDRLVVDTTGSVIYVRREVIRSLRRFAEIVLLDAQQAQIEMLCQKYFEEPKPVLWRDEVYAPLCDESKLDALKRCFPKLLQTRNLHYYGLATHVIPYGLHRSPAFTTKDFLREVLRSI